MEKALTWETGPQGLNAALGLAKLWDLRQDISPLSNFLEHLHDMLNSHVPFNPYHQRSGLLVNGTLQMEKPRHPDECVQAHKLLSGDAKM